MMKKIFDWCWPFPRFGWDELIFTDKLKLFAFYVQAGAGMSMTLFALWVLWNLARLDAVWPMFYLGAMALVLVGIVVTGLASLLIKRTVEAEVGPIKFKTSDTEAAKALTAMATEQEVNPDKEVR